MLWTVMSGRGVSDKDYEELLNGFEYELEDDDDVEAMMLLWDEAAEATSENEMDYDEPEEWWF